MKKPRRADQPRVKAAAPEVVLWRPSIVLASRIEVPARRKPVTLAAPTAQPEAGEERIAGSILSVADTGAMLAARATQTRPPAGQADSLRAGVSAAGGAHRLVTRVAQGQTGPCR